MNQQYFNPTPESGRDFMMRNIQGKVVMLNLLKFKKVADYSANPELAPANPISGEKAYELYIEHTLPYLKKSGGEVLFWGKGGNFLIGPIDEQWDAVLLIRQNSVDDFISFASNQEYLKGMGHRIAALEDSRLLPLVEEKQD